MICFVFFLISISASLDRRLKRVFAKILRHKQTLVKSYEEFAFRHGKYLSSQSLADFLSSNGITIEKPYLKELIHLTRIASGKNRISLQDVFNAIRVSDKSSRGSETRSRTVEVEEAESDNEDTYKTEDGGHAELSEARPPTQTGEPSRMNQTSETLSRVYRSREFR